MKEFLQERVGLARVLAVSQDLPVRYADIALILCTVLMACAARRWPGKGFDRKRFVELLVQRTDDSLCASWVSVPALVNSRQIREEDTPWGVPGYSTLILKDGEIDLEYSAARIRYPQCAAGQLRKCTYASLIYERLRCTYAHEYLSGPEINPVPATHANARVSYIGRSTRGSGVTRRIHFHLEYLLALAQHHVDTLSDAPEPLPTAWWCETA